jgi:hypothetical protein
MDKYVNIFIDSLYEANKYSFDALFRINHLVSLWDQFEMIVLNHIHNAIFFFI